MPPRNSVERIPGGVDSQIRSIQKILTYVDSESPLVDELADWIDRQKVIKTLRQNNISSKVYWDPPVHQTEYYTQTTDQIPTLPTTEEVSSQVLSLPMYPSLSHGEIDRVVSGIKRAIDSH
jgi:dTDP-4-amino-4,6-dideoxygalactose transaminase